MTPTPRRSLVHLSGRWANIGLFVLALIAALRLGSTLVLPILMAGLLALVLAPPVAWLARHRVPHALAAGLVMLAIIGTAGTAIRVLGEPAVAWLDRAPATLEQARHKLRRLTGPIEQLQQTAEKVEEVTQGDNGAGRSRAIGQAAPGGLFQKLSGTTIAFVGALASVLFLSFFLLATGHRLREKLDTLLPTRHRRAVTDGVSEIQVQMSRYLAATTLINTGVGLVTYLVMLLVGMPNPGLWGVVAGVLNFIPYLGAVVTVGVILLAGLVSFDEPGRALLAAGLFLAVNMAEAYVVTPVLLGRRLPLNPVAIFGGLLFWGWLWGVTGAILAVPLTVCLKVIADRVEPLKPAGAMLGP